MGRAQYEYSDDYLRNSRVAVAGLATDAGAATADTKAATCNDMFGVITTESLTTAQNGIYDLTLTNSKITAGDLVFASVADGSNTQGTPMIGQVKPAASSCLIEVINKHATSEAFNGTLKISFMVVKALA